MSVLGRWMGRAAGRQGGADLHVQVGWATCTCGGGHRHVRTLRSPFCKPAGAVSSSPIPAGSAFALCAECTSRRVQSTWAVRPMPTLLQRCIAGTCMPLSPWQTTTASCCRLSNDGVHPLDSLPPSFSSPLCSTWLAIANHTSSARIRTRKSPTPVHTQPLRWAAAAAAGAAGDPCYCF